MGHFEDRLERKMANPEFALGYREAIAEAIFTEITADEGVELTLNVAMAPEVEIEFSWAAPVYARVYLPCA